MDLGLDVKWATCNIGASSPNEYGYRFAWGETDPNRYGADKHIAEGIKSLKDYGRGYDWFYYKWGREESDGTVVFTKYYTERWENDKKVLDLSDDAAHVHWGGEWRMPTDYDFLQLIRNCDIKINPFTCIVTVTSKINGNVIYFPIVHLYRNEILITHYWASTLDPYNNEKAFLVDFRHFGESAVYSSHRCSGYPVRPVIKR